MGVSKVIFEKKYISNGSYATLSDSLVNSDFSRFLDGMSLCSATLMLDKQEVINDKFVDYHIWGMREGVVVYRMESQEGKKALSRAVVTIWPNDDKSLPRLEKRTLSALAFSN